MSHLQKEKNLLNIKGYITLFNNMGIRKPLLNVPRGQKTLKVLKLPENLN